MAPTKMQLTTDAMNTQRTADGMRCHHLGQRAAGPPSVDADSEVTIVADPLPLDTVAELDALATPGPDLIATASHICDRLAQAFGVAELGMFTDDGEIRRHFVRKDLLNEVRTWASRSGITVTDAGLAY